MLRRVLFMLLFIGAAAGFWVAAERWNIEKANRSVALTVEWPEVRQWSAVFRVPLNELLDRFGQAGVTSVALQEQSVHQLVDDGQIFRPDPFTDQRVRALVGTTRDATVRQTVLAFPDTTLEQRVEQYLDQRWGKDRVHALTLGAMPALLIDGGYAQFRDLGVGLDPLSEAAVLQSGLEVVARVKNYPGLTEPQIQWTLSNLVATGAHTVIFNGDDVLGNPDLIHQTAEALRSSGLHYGYVEFGKQHGDDRLAQALEGQFVRVHTIQGAELSNITQPAAIDRFIKAVRERNIRLCYIHFFSSVTGSTLEEDEEFIRRIAAGLRTAGYLVPQHVPGRAVAGNSTTARPFPPWRAPLAAQVLLTAGLVAASALLFLELWGSLPPWSIAALAMLFLGLAGGLLKVWALAAEGGALLSALVFPTLSMVLARLPTDEGSLAATTRNNTGHRAAALAGLVGLLRTSAFSLLGSIYIIGFLGGVVFMSKTQQFVGIKPAIVLPVLAVIVLYGGRLLDPGSPAERWSRLTARVAGLMKQPLLIWHVAALAALLIVLGLLVARSGNDSAVGATVFELKTRRILDGWLVARPRTKEFLLGNPALYLAFYAAARGWRRWVLPLVIIGSIGQTSLVNTFCHIHTPLYISLFHALNGLWLGALLGWGLAVVWNRMAERDPPRQPEAPSRNGRGDPGPGAVSAGE